MHCESRAPNEFPRLARKMAAPAAESSIHLEAPVHGVIQHSYKLIVIDY